MTAQTRTLQIRVSPEAAAAYESATPDRQRKLDLLLSLKLDEATRPLEQIMDEISLKAQERGLTPEILESILREP